MVNGIKSIAIGVLLATLGCQEEPEPPKEPWIDKPIAQWPSFSLTNQIEFKDKVYKDFANAFLIDTGQDTLGVSCKHLFMVFKNQLGLETIDLGPTFQDWKLYPKNNSSNAVVVKNLINTNPTENIGEFNTLKVRDWILFEIENLPPDLYPLKIRYTPIQINEIVYAVGWGAKQQDNSAPALTKLQCVDNLADYYYMKSFDTNPQPQGRSGSPVIDENGYLVGIISGAEGKLAVIGSVHYLKKLFEDYNIDYRKANYK